MESPVVPKLVITKGLSPETFCVTSSSIYLGRLPTNDFVLAGEGISRKHARIHRRGNGYYIQDLGSTNGTFVNDIRVDSEKQLSHGDVIRLGRAVALKFDFPILQEEHDEASPDALSDDNSADSPVLGSVEEIPNKRQEAELDEAQPEFEAVQALSGPNQKVSDLALKVNELISRIIQNSDSIKSQLEGLNAAQEKHGQNDAQLEDAEENVSSNEQDASFDMSAAANALSAIREDAVQAANILYSLLQELDACEPNGSKLDSYSLEESNE